VLARLDRTEVAGRTYEYLTGRYPDFAPGWSSLAFFHHTNDRNAEALAAIDNAIRCASSDGESYYYRAVYLAALDNLDGAFHAAAEVVDRGLLDELAADPAVEQLVADPRWAALRELSS
jgi:tetratricopeptide (TPR) repeat protein